MHNLDHAAGAVEPRIGARHTHGAHVDVGCEHVPAQRAGGGDGKYAAAGPEVENVPGASACVRCLAEPVEREQTAAGRAVMTGAEGERRFNFDADAVRWNAGAVVARHAQ